MMVYLHSSELLARLANAFCNTDTEDDFKLVLSDLEEIVRKAFNIQPKCAPVHCTEDHLIEVLRADTLLSSVLIEYTVFEFKLLDHDGNFIIIMEF